MIRQRPPVVLHPGVLLVEVLTLEDVVQNRLCTVRVLERRSLGRGAGRYAILYTLCPRICHNPLSTIFLYNRLWDSPCLQANHLS